MRLLESLSGSLSRDSLLPSKLRVRTVSNLAPIKSNLELRLTLDAVFIEFVLKNVLIKHTKCRKLSHNAKTVLVS